MEKNDLISDQTEKLQYEGRGSLKEKGEKSEKGEKRRHGGVTGGAWGGRRGGFDPQKTSSKKQGKVQEEWGGVLVNDWGGKIFPKTSWGLHYPSHREKNRTGQKKVWGKELT